MKRGEKEDIVFFQEEKLFEHTKEESNKLMTSLKPVIDQLCICRIQKLALPYIGCDEQKKAISEMENYLVDLILQIIGYEKR